jgi:hypothetical protein
MIKLTDYSDCTLNPFAVAFASISRQEAWFNVRKSKYPFREQFQLFQDYDSMEVHAITNPLHGFICCKARNISCAQNHRVSEKDAVMKKSDIYN